ncbi:cytochrome P450 [Gloeocapsa sp. PCC 73106]|uniref:cytochrome P450 n=1 Tax=Gloeocapsa sp. PCC 73106 TaxID=102232 RepID=UPI0002ABAA05|nr:cytochrome P450 [Gloeocapsa sp. PCC 73106]ELR97024.1 cytochrome P450 [Gloeocapsa sp. PCC 73106]
MKTISGPKTPNLLQAMEWILAPINYLEKASKNHPEVFKSGILPIVDHLVLVSNPKILQNILTNDRQKFMACKDGNEILISLLGNHSLVMLEGDRHKQRRQLLMPSFHGQQISKYGDDICQITHQVMAETPHNQVFTARSLTQSITLGVMMQEVFGLREGERYQRLQTLLISLLGIFNVPINVAFLFFPSLQKNLGKWSPWGYFLSIRKQIDDLIYTEIAERRQSGMTERNDILSLLMNAKDSEGNSLTDEELRDELLTLLFAGYETTANALAWSLYWAHRLPEVKAKILAELATLENHDPSAIARLPYLSAVCQETLRLYPIALVTFPRLVKEATELEGYHFPANTIILGSIYQIHHRPEIYPEPEMFKPERFLEKQFSPYEYLPFGGGVRRCLGEVLAQFEMKLALAEILSHYELILADQRPEKPQRSGVLLGPARGVPMILKETIVR